MEHILHSLFFNGYNLYNTFIYTFIVFCCYILFYRFLKAKLPEIKINKYFLYSVLPFVLLGSLLRILEQEYTGVWLIKHSNSPLEIGFYFHTPGWLIFLGFLFLLCFSAAVFFIKDKKNYYKILIPLGLALCLPLLFYELIHINNLKILFFTLATTFLVYLIIIFVLKRTVPKIITPLENKLIILSQTIDSLATIFGIMFFKNQLYEQHPVSRIVIAINPFLFLIVKITLALLFITLVDKVIQKEEERIYIKTLIIILGFLTGIRDLLTISLLRI